jgi:hypothetical protein
MVGKIGHKPVVGWDAQEGHWRRKYGITRADYETMLTAQSYVCAICHQPEQQIDNRRNGSGKLFALSVDHDHRTGRVRGLLCKYCNGTIARFEARREQIEIYLAS